MGAILDYIENNNQVNVHCYKTRKLTLDDADYESITSENSDTDTIPMDTSGRIAEDDTRRVHTVRISRHLIETMQPWFTYFLDGSRHTYKVDDISIGSKIYPVVAGQVIVGCCHRPDRDTFKMADLRIQIILSLPKQFHVGGKAEDYARLYCERLNDYLRANNRYIAARGIGVSQIVFYPTDGPSVGDATDKNRYKNSAIARIQNAMTDDEQLLVKELCNQKKLNDENWLIKDGSLQYNPHFSSFGFAEWHNMRSNYKYVVGVSKSFDPDLIKNFEGRKLSSTIANLKPFERTKAYKYTSEHSNGMTFAVWYLRLRKEHGFRETHFSDVVKCEMIMFNPAEPIKSSTIDAISANLIREAYPVCFGSDVRWGNHIYPVYLTETYCKSQYIDSNIFLSLF